MDHQKKLLDAFPAVSKEEWLAKVEKDLKGRPISELDFQIDPSITLKPFYHADDAIVPNFINRDQGDNSWQIMESFDLSDANLKEYNATILAALQGGIQALHFSFSQAPHEEDWAILLEGVYLEYVSIHLYSNNATEAFKALSSLYAHAQELNVDTTTLNGSVDASFFSFFDKRLFFDYLNMGKEFFPRFQLFTAKSSNENQDVVDELLNLLQNGHQFLSTYDRFKIDLEEIAARLQFKLSLTADYFLSIAKIRAFRLLWGTVLEAYQLNASCTLLIEFDKKAYGEDPYKNMIAATTMAMSATMGGVDYLLVAPASMGTTKEVSQFERRIARNVQHLMTMEGQLNHVIDPATGSYYIEHLSNEIAEKVWSRFQQLE